MKAENISDALNFLDDDIIEETERIRSKKKSYKSRWIKCLSAAACLCIALVAVFGIVPQFDSPLRGNDLNSANNSSWAGTKGESQFVDEYKYGGGLGYVAGSISMPADGVYLEITEWKKNCFYALVLGSENKELTNGMKVKVKLNKTSEYCKYSDGGVKIQLDGESAGSKSYYWFGWDEDSYSQGRPVEEDFPVGTKVCVTFSKIRNSFLNNKADKVITATHLYEYRGETPARGPGDTVRITYYVEITKWGKKEFEGIIKGTVDGVGGLPLGKEVTVKFDENIRVRKQGEKFENRVPTEEDFPVGTRVEVLAVEKNEPQYLGKSEITIYSIGDLSMPQTVVVKIDEWNDNGFMGTFSGENGQQISYSVCNTAIVEFTEDTRMETRTRLGTTIISLAPTEEDFPVGAMVEVSYKKSMQKSSDEIVYTAERVWLYE
ncbi:MAG: hypothetical protein IJW04_06215 [Ruminococcus sp.]|nr:hypothetical protein [Ruminococcus sp.]